VLGFVMNGEQVDGFIMVVGGLTSLLLLSWARCQEILSVVFIIVTS